MANLTIRDLLVDLNKVRYGGTDFNSITNDLYSRMQIKFASDYNDFVSSGIGIVFLDVIAFALDTLSFYLDRRASDNFLVTARSRKSVSRLARQLGYKVQGAIPASVDLLVALQIIQAIPVTIFNTFQFTTDENIIYQPAQSTVFDIGDGPNDFQVIPCYQGETQSESFVSTGLPNQVFELTKVGTLDYISSGSVDVIVNGSVFVENDFLTFEDTDQFEVNYVDDPVTLRFGDGIAGNIPLKGATIQVNYVTTKGKAGLVAENTITSSVLPLIVGSTTVPLIINNDESSVGGDDIESLSRIKTFAGKKFAARGVAVTTSDYNTLAGSFSDPLFGRVAAASAINSKNATSDIGLQNIIFNILALVTQNQDDITTTLSSFLTDLQNIITDLSTTSDLLDASTAKVTDLTSSLESILLTLRGYKNISQTLYLDSTEMIDSINDLLIYVNALPIGVADALTTATKDSILNNLTTIAGDLAEFNSNSSSLSVGLTSTISNLSSTLDTVSLLTEDISSLTEQVDNFTTVIGDETTTTGLFSTQASLVTLESDITSQVTDLLTQINEHVSLVLSSDCSANLITVPILALNSEGFYAPPSIGLIKSLQAFIDERKEVTQLVNVTSGELSLVPAVITIKIGVFSGFSESLVSTTAGLIVDNILRNRKFGQDLYVSDIICAVKDLGGVFFVNITIDGHVVSGNTVADKLDANGNLIIEDYEIITKGEINIEVNTIVN